MRFEIVARDPGSAARRGRLYTPHGVIDTPVFMPVGTRGTVKAMTPEMLDSLGVPILLANTYHLYLRPGHETIRALGGLHRFIGWPRALLTDSGGFQIMSLQELREVTEEGVRFQSHLDGSSHWLSPERVVEIQLALGADIMMILDQCLEYPATHESAERAMNLTGRWAKRAKEFWQRRAISRLATTAASGDPEAPLAIHQSTDSALFGIVQGGVYRDLRRTSAEQMQEVGFEGYAIGGLGVGEPKAETYSVAEFTAALLPKDQPRYLMGVGTPEDLVECVALGIDMFDCVMPTRNARNGCLFTSQGKLAIKSARYARDANPVDAACGCFVCRKYSRAFLRHLFAVGEMLGAILGTYHNLYFYLDTMRKIRDAIGSGEYNKLWSRVRAANGGLNF